MALIGGAAGLLPLLHLVPERGPGGGPLRARCVQRYIQTLCQLALFLTGFYELPVQGREHLAAAREARAIVVFNHESYVDPLVLVSTIPLSGVAKAGVAGLPFIGDFARAMQWLFVERRGTADRGSRHTLKGDAAVQAIRDRALHAGCAADFVPAPSAWPGPGLASFFSPWAWPVTRARGCAGEG